MESLFDSLSVLEFRHCLPNVRIARNVRKQIVGHSSEDIRGRYVYLELTIQAKAIVSLHSLF
jgi:hypothetical protein